MPVNWLASHYFNQYGLRINCNPAIWWRCNQIKKLLLRTMHVKIVGCKMMSILSGSNMLNRTGCALLVSVKLRAGPIVNAFDLPWNLPHGLDKRFGFRRSIDSRHPSFPIGAQKSTTPDRGRGHRSTSCCVSSLDHSEELWVIGRVRPLRLWSLST